ncbi:glucose-6-phosphate isomerase, partial [Arthrobacter terricola]
MSTLSYDASGAAQQAIEQHVRVLVEDRVATRIFAKDASLWGPEAESEAAIRLGWVEAAAVSRALVGGILELRDAFRAEGVSRIVLCGMGGSSLAPEVIAGTAGVGL